MIKSLWTYVPSTGEIREFECSHNTKYPSAVCLKCNKEIIRLTKEIHEETGGALVEVYLIDERLAFKVNFNEFSPYAVYEKKELTGKNDS